MLTVGSWPAAPERKAGPSNVDSIHQEHGNSENTKLVPCKDWTKPQAPTHYSQFTTHCYGIGLTLALAVAARISTALNTCPNLTFSFFACWLLSWFTVGTTTNGAPSISV